jgi:MFS family permease
VGVGNGLLTPYTLALTANRVKPEQRDVAFGIVTACIHVGILVSPFIQAVIAGVSNNPSYRYLYTVAAICLLVLAIISLFFREKDQEAASNAA